MACANHNFLAVSVSFMHDIDKVASFILAFYSPFSLAFSYLLHRIGSNSNSLCLPYAGISGCALRECRNNLELLSRHYRVISKMRIQPPEDKYQRNECNDC